MKNALTLLHQSIFFQNFSYNNTNLVKIKSANNISFWQERTKFQKINIQKKKLFEELKQQRAITVVCVEKGIFFFFSFFSKFKTFINMKLVVDIYRILCQQTTIALYFRNSSIDFHVRIRGFRSFLLLKPRVDSDNLIDESTSKSLDEMHFPLALLYRLLLAAPLFLNFSSLPS